MYKCEDTPKRFDIENSIYDAELLENMSTGKIHWHSHFLLSVFKRNSGVQVLNNVEYPFHPGVAILMGPFDFHYNKIDDGQTFDVYSVKFSHAFFDKNLCQICDLESFPIVCKLSQEDFALAEKLCEALVREQRNENLPGHEIFSQNIIEQLVILIVRNAKNSVPAKAGNLNIRRALLYIHDNFRNSITVDDVAAVCHYAPNYFSTCFKKETGIAFQHYLLNLRLDFAHNLIKYGKRSCTEACFEAGFNSVEYFSAAFKKKYGYSPKNCK